MRIFDFIAPIPPYPELVIKGPKRLFWLNTTNLHVYELHHWYVPSMDGFIGNYNVYVAACRILYIMGVKCLWNQSYDSQ